MAFRKGTSADRTQSPALDDFPLHTFCQEGNLEKVKQCVKKKYDLNGFDDKHWTPLHCAANARQLAICKYLLSKGANPSLTTSNNATALHYLARMREHPLLPPLLKTLVDKGADVNHPNTYANTPLHEAALRGSVVCIQFLLANNAKIDFQNNYGETALHMATRGGNYEAVELLLRKGARPDIVCKEGTCLEQAERVFDPDIVLKLKDLVSRVTFGESSQTRTAINYDSLPPEIVELAVQAKIRPQVVDQHFDLFVDIVRFATGTKLLPVQDLNLVAYENEDPRSVYKLEEIPSGKGSYGAVYLGRNINTKKVVAIKRMENKTDSQYDSITNEIQQLRKCQHKNIVTLLEAYNVVDTSEVWMVMEHLEGGTLQATLRRIRLTEAQIAYIVKNMLEGLQKMHSKYIVHRDIKSSNVMLSTQGDVKLVDFGLAMDLSRGGKLKIVGSPFWMAPEIIRREPHTYAVDLWSLGITILEMANGKPPNHDNKLRAMFATATGQPLNFTDPGHWSRDMAHFLGECLKTVPSERPSCEMLLNHAWLGSACSREELVQLLSTVFLEADFTQMGL